MSIDIVALRSVNEAIKIYGVARVIAQYERVKEQLEDGIEHLPTFDTRRRAYWQKQIDEVNEMLVYLEERIEER